MQWLQFFVSESKLDAEKVNGRRLKLLADPAAAPHGAGVLVIDDSGDRKDGAKTAYVGHQWLGLWQRRTAAWSPSPRCGLTSGFIIRCMRCRSPRPDTSTKGKRDPAFRTKLAIGADLAARARAEGFDVTT